MFYKGSIYWILPSLMSLMMLSVIAYYVPIARAQQDSTSTNLQTYINADLGIILKYPSNWTVNDTRIQCCHEVVFWSPDGVAAIKVNVEKFTLQEAGVTNLNERANQLSTREKDSGAQLIEIDSNRYFLSGHPAIRIIEIGSASDYPARKMMTYESFAGDKEYRVFYSVSPPEKFDTYLSIAQSMIDSLEMISKQ
jgi:hypothetical protein